ncbi:MAG TPA: ADP-ribosylglycohydrolase family protein [Pseudonocardiaceae bacterium]
MRRNEVLDRVGGALLGVAAGDALGATLEFRSAEWIAANAEGGVHKEIVGGGAFGWRPGQGTDDTDMTAAVARAYASGYSLTAVAEGFLRWYETSPPDIGNLTRAALAHLAANGDPTASGRAANPGGSAGNGSLMRCVPTALARADRDSRLREAAEISLITHDDERCVQACQVYVELVAALVDGADADGALAAVDGIATNAEVFAALATDPRTDVRALRTSGYVVDSLAAAVWALRQERSFEELVVALVNRGDDADTTGAIAGGLLGARDGLGAVPARWLERLEYRAEFNGLAERLTALRLG